MIKLKNILNEGSADGGKMAKTHVVYAMNVKLNDKNSLGDNEVETGFRVSVKKGPDAESRAKKLAQKHFGKNFNSIIGIGKALNPEKSTISEAEEDTLMKLNDMVKGDLERIGDYAQMILDRLNKGEQLSAWMYSQITLSVDQLNSVHDTMDGKDGVVEKKLK
jgi:hypothetical protein